MGDRLGATYRPFSFFFQAEDGIRDSSVTGVQTCALPILAGGARWGAPLWSGGGARRRLGLCGLLRGTPLRGWDETTWPAKEGGDTAARLQNWSCASLSTANFGRRGRLMREKIIGHGMRGLAPSIAVHRSFLHNRMLALLHQPARQQSRGVLIEPGIQQLRDLFTEIGGVVQAGKFVAVQRIARGREEELPPRLNL